MNDFEGLEYRDSRLLYFSGVSLLDLAKEFGTPLYVYSEEIIRKQIQSYFDGIQGRSVILCYSVKANSNLSILQLIKDSGLGADIVSGGELYRCKIARIPTNRIVFSGVGKTKEEIRFALQESIMLFSIESEQELNTIQEIARDMDTIAPVSIRVNPDINPDTHPYISTGLKENKFGISANHFESIIQHALSLKNIELLGFGYHIGSQITNIDAKLEAAEKSKHFIRIFKKYKNLQFLDIGGGLGIQYKNEIVPSPKEYVQAVLSVLPDEDFIILMEPGRSIVGPSGVFLTKILYKKKSYEKLFYIVDGAMNDFIRPSLYEAYHEILPVYKNEDRQVKADVVGPVCETGDFFAKSREFPLMKEGDILAIVSTGAYGFVMSSQYNSRPRPSEVLIRKDGTYQLIRERETYQDLVNKELKFL